MISCHDDSIYKALLEVHINKSIIIVMFIQYICISNIIIVVLEGRFQLGVDNDAEQVLCWPYQGWKADQVFVYH